ncbi:GEVED domain-containing protein [Planctomycetota bacterium]
MKKANPHSIFPLVIIAAFTIIVIGGGRLAAIGDWISSELIGFNAVQPYDQDTISYNWKYVQEHKIHWSQLPDFGNPGLDVDMAEVSLADDFQCMADGPVSDIHIWTSFANDNLPQNGPESLLFVLSIYEDIPAQGDVWSRPGKLLWREDFASGEYSARTILNRSSGWYDPLKEVFLPNNHRQAFQYNFVIDNDPFIQSEGEIYWLGVQQFTLYEDDYKIGWKTTTKKFGWNDNSVYVLAGNPVSFPISYPKSHEYENESVNLAFTINDGMDTNGQHDLGDAPDSTNSFPGTSMLAYSDPNVTANYPTVFWTEAPPYGPMHWYPEDRFYLGDVVTLENDADKSYDEDIFNNLDPENDIPDRDAGDDGLQLPLVLPHCQETSLNFRATFTNSLDVAYVNLWCDWNRDGDWEDIMTCSNGTAAEWAVQNAVITISSAGTVDINTPDFLSWHPQIKTSLDPMWLRISIAEQPWNNTVAGSGPAGGYIYGETEDYYIYPKGESELFGFDWGDAPDGTIAPGYPTLDFTNGANHLIAGPWFGDYNDIPDEEKDGQPETYALGDDIDTKDDEGGVTIPPLIAGYPADVTVEVSGGGGIVQAWIDFDKDQSWYDSEQVYNDFLPPGTHVISFIVPDDALEGYTFARFRINRDGQLDPHGAALDGEVEDYEVHIQRLSDNTKWIQLPDVTPYGIDIQADMNDGNFRHVADDFECTSTDLITDVHLWGSWKNDEIGDIRNIRLSIYSDDPAGLEGYDSDNPYSIPAAQVLWQQDFSEGQFFETLYHVVRQPGEWWWDPVSGELIEGGDRQIWRIDIYIDPIDAFVQQGTIDNSEIYWLEVQVDSNDGEFGWKTRRWPDHYMDDAVWDVGSEMPRLWKELRYPQTHPYHDIEKNSIDMAFQLTYDQNEPYQPTSRPVSATQCPAVATKCPTVATTCPPVNTQCPVVNTKCPAVQTQCVAITMCPPVDTTCPAVSTQCPTVATECPAVATRCPTVDTRCPAVDTQCPVVETVCPVVQTRCPAVYTRCPPFDTQCNIEETVCPVVETKCPPVNTRCPVVDTQCPAVETECPHVSTRCPPIYTRCPAVDTRCPAVETECPVFDTECPPFDTWCPPYDTYCPPIETECPPVLSVCPPVPTQCTPVFTVCPALETECPTDETRCPFDPTQCMETVFPPVDTQCRIVETECPAVLSVCPPVRTQCTPVFTVCPAVETGCPAPATQCPMETSCPVAMTKCPIVETDCPVVATYCPPIKTLCPYDQTVCPEPNPTGSCDPPPVGFLRTIIVQTQSGSSSMEIQCPVILVPSPTVITKPVAKLL